MLWLQALLEGIIRPIIQDEIQSLKAFAFNQHSQLESYKKWDLEAEEHIKKIAEATTAEERWAHVRRLQSSRPKFNS